MPDLFDLARRWWKYLVSLIAVATVVSAIIAFLIPKRYLGMATALPAPAYATDKGSVFNQNLQELYTALGTPDDLDKILGTARLDTIYRAVARQKNMALHYKMPENEEALEKATRVLKRGTRVIKTDYGELQVKTWDADKTVAASLANAIMEGLQYLHQNIQAANNEHMLAKIKEAYAEKKLEYLKFQDSVGQKNPATPNELLGAEKTALLQQLLDYEKLLNQYQLITAARPQALIIVERAAPSSRPDTPRIGQIIVGTVVLSLIFGLLLILILERKRSPQ